MKPTTIERNLDAILDEIEGARDGGTRGKLAKRAARKASV